MNNLPFSEKRIEKELSELQVTSTQRQIIDDMGEILGSRLEMSPLSMRGFYSMALIAWQKQINMTTADTEIKMGTTKRDRIMTAKEILAIMRERVLPIVQVKGKQHLLDDAISDALNHYTEKFASRPPDPT